MASLSVGLCRRDAVIAASAPVGAGGQQPRGQRPVPFAGGTVQRPPAPRLGRLDIRTLSQQEPDLSEGTAGSRFSAERRVVEGREAIGREGRCDVWARLEKLLQPIGPAESRSIKNFGRRLWGLQPFR